MESASIIAVLLQWLYGPWMMLGFLLVGLYLSLRLGFLQFSQLGTVLRETLGSIRERAMGFGGQISPFQAAMIGASGVVGNGHLVGMVSAVLVGGAGAVFWMWVGYLFGAATKFAEATLAVHFRRQYPDGTVSGGPTFYISRGLGAGWRWLAVLFGLFAAISAFGIGNAYQAVAVGGVLAGAYQVPPAITGLLLALLVAFILGGGVVRVGAVAQWLLPLKLVLFLVAIVPLLLVYGSQLSQVLWQIFSSAFDLQAAAGGAVGLSTSKLVDAFSAGMGRGIFANEAGQGSTPFAHAQAQVDHPVRQGFWGVTEILISGTVTTLMALTFLASGLASSFQGQSAGAAFVGLFQAHPLGAGLASVLIAIFALGTMITWGFYGEEAATFVFGEGIRWPYRLTYSVLAFLAPLGGLEALQSLSDTLVGLQALPNLLALVLLSPLVVRLVQDFFRGEPWRPPEDR